MPVHEPASDFLVANDDSTVLADVVKVGFPPRDDAPLGDAALPKDVDVDVAHAGNYAMKDCLTVCSIRISRRWGSF